MRSNLNKEPDEVGSEGRLAKVLEQHGLKWTTERRGIVQAVARMDGHFTADDLATFLRKAGVSASRATVFRVLPLLVEAGIVQPMMLRGEVRRYERVCADSHHDHLVCTSCGRIVEFEFDAFEILQREVASRYGFSLQGHVHELFGVCEDCRKTPGRRPS